MHIVELQYSDDPAANIVAAMRKWRDSAKAQPTIRYSLLVERIRQMEPCE
jgi:hypothetical protein